ncbi:Nif3-like dinuclear metal center hexameric protein [Liquorilactobacillus satsumensis]|uniref:GTP cyclohydrolase 1 type 2 homolog n=1 Tax=Liquorilactobacillus satsumensis DSM 16230 = JCM 12392 TaxID=1423801 RepID=A0A0R1V1R4_9LACO|nr:Nif3-like dinuclear metal center hexameric protein [Liquorilactobacillus satsumensis]KRL99462.1 hypothetical protein FD50_GL000160 [Liquorilactobacillus satsumensis DSM 16230 = JCM 12392]MCP9312101.1 Nif3-like dinuclear metal center hexameric protein [Liquorilactobacillus satsumensis]MCP9359379.1 Nif3-like dinuclear metal center hexameric protein [Liquorilactobacillus satsumensis]
MTKVRDIINRFEEFAPQSLAEPGDPVGLQLGDYNAQVKKMMVTLDVRPAVVAEALKNNVDFIFAHHPAMFHPLKNFDLSVPQNAMYAELIKHNITVYAAHTNLDNANGGMNDWLAEALGLLETKPLLPVRELPLLKLAVFVPSDAADQMRRALAAAGAGQIGEYRNCSFSVKGTGRFVPSAKADPAYGAHEKLACVTEEKVEVVFPQSKKRRVLAAMRTAHPYEEPVFDLFTLKEMGEKYGMGRVGNLPREMSVQQFAEDCKRIFAVPHLRLISSDLQQSIKRVAVLGGSGGQFYQAAQRKGAQMYVTGDLSYHTGHDLLACGLSAVDPGHHIEQICKQQLAAKFNTWNTEAGWQIEVFSSKLNTDPFKFI